MERGKRYQPEHGVDLLSQIKLAIANGKTQIEILTSLIETLAINVVLWLYCAYEIPGQQLI